MPGGRSVDLLRDSFPDPQPDRRFLGPPVDGGGKGVEAQVHRLEEVAAPWKKVTRCSVHAMDAEPRSKAFELDEKTTSILLNKFIGSWDESSEERLIFKSKLMSHFSIDCSGFSAIVST